MLSSEVHETMEDNFIRTTTETREDNNRVAVEIQDNTDFRQGYQGIQRRTSTVTEMRDIRDRYGGGGDVGRQQMRCGTTEMAKWVGRTARNWANIDRE